MVVGFALFLAWRRFRSARDNLTQSDLARKVGVRLETVVFLEKGKYIPSLKLAYDIAQIFGMSIEEVFVFSQN
ncbi:MAG: helix-turn-helix transcriptional regulator [Bacteroidota bacterium]